RIPVVHANQRVEQVAPEAFKVVGFAPADAVESVGECLHIAVAERIVRIVRVRQLVRRRQRERNALLVGLRRAHRPTLQLPSVWWVFGDGDLPVAIYFDNETDHRSIATIRSHPCPRPRFAGRAERAAGMKQSEGSMWCYYQKFVVR